MSPLVFSIRNLDAYNASVVLERFFSLVGVVLFTPVPLPEQDKNIREVVCSRYTSFAGIIAMRFLLVLPVLPLLVGAMCAAMAASGSVFPFATWWLGSSVSAFFLGALGFFAFSATGNWVAGYLAPACYFAINMGAGPKLGRFYLFSLGMGSLTEKYWLLGFGILFVIAALAILFVKQKKGWGN